MAQPERLRLERTRLERAAADLAIPDSERLSEQHRAQTLHALRDLFGTLEDVLRQSLASMLIGLGPAGRDAAVELSGTKRPIVWPKIERIVLAPPLDLLDAALIRAGEHALAAGARGRGESVIAQLLSRSPDSQLAQRLASLELAESRRRDEFGEPRLPFVELDDSEAERAAWLAAAAMRAELLSRHPLDESMLDAALEACVRRMIAERPGDSADRQADAVMRRLDALQALDDDLLAALAQAGETRLLIAALAYRGSVAARIVSRLLCATDDSGWLLLVRAFDLPSEIVALLTGLHGLRDDSASLESRTARMAAVSLADARRQLARWRRDARFVTAIEAMDASL